MDGLSYEGISVLHTPYQFTFHLVTKTKAWFLFVSPNANWTYYTFAWSEHDGIRSYENARLVLHNKQFRNVSALLRGYFLLNVGEIYTSAHMHKFLTRMKAWNRDLTASQINADFKEGK